MNSEDQLIVQGSRVNGETEESGSSSVDGGLSTSRGDLDGLVSTARAISVLVSGAEGISDSNLNRSSLVLSISVVTNCPTSANSVLGVVSQVESVVEGVGSVFQSSSQETLLGSSSSVLVVLVLRSEDRRAVSWDVSFRVASGVQRSKSEISFLETDFNGVRGGDDNVNSSVFKGSGFEGFVVVSRLGLSSLEVRDDKSVLGSLSGSKGDDGQKENCDEASHFVCVVRVVWVCLTGLFGLFRKKRKKKKMVVFWSTRESVCM